MNAVDRCVKKCLLNYPTLFTKRADVLHHIFCVVGNGYEVGVGGNIYEEFDESKDDQSIELLDVEHKLETRYHEDYKSSDPFMIRMIAEARMVYEQDNLQREFRNKNIDLISSKKCDDDEVTDGIYPMSKKYSLLSCAPKSLNVEWSAALVEIAECIIYTIKCNYNSDIENIGKDDKKNLIIAYRAIERFQTKEHRKIREDFDKLISELLDTVK